MKQIFLLPILLLVAFSHLLAQTQTVKGQITDKQSEMPIIGATYVWLGDDAHTKTLRFEQAADHRHAEAGVVHIGVARDQHDVATVPAELLISVRLMGKKRDVPKRAAQYLR